MKTILIADIGINHNASVGIAKAIIKECNDYGIDYVKFQKRTPEVCTPEGQRGVMRETPWGAMTYFNYRNKMEFKYSDYMEIDEYCKVLGQKWFMSVWDTNSLITAIRFEPDYIKIPSAKITDMELLQKANICGMPLIISTGGCTEEMIDKAVHATKANLDCIMQCTSTYPCKAEEVNLSYIPELRNRYPGVKIGFSNHFPGMTANLGAIALGVDMLEFHVTLDTTMWGTDHASSCPVDKIPYLLKHINTLEQMRGDGIKQFYESEKPVMERLRT